MDYTMDVTGTHIWYYFICKREVWLITRNIAPDQEDENMDLGRFINEHTYQRDKQEVLIGNIKVDRIRREEGQLVIGEVKKSSRFIESSRFQLLFYLQTLKKMGIDARGELMFPEEKKKQTVELTACAEQELNQAVEEIKRIARQSVPPPPVKIGFCRNCAYREYCWAEG